MEVVYAWLSPHTHKHLPKGKKKRGDWGSGGQGPAQSWRALGLGRVVCAAETDELHRAGASAFGVAPRMGWTGDPFVLRLARAANGGGVSHFADGRQPALQGGKRAWGWDDHGWSCQIKCRGGKLSHLAFSPNRRAPPPLRLTNHLPMLFDLLWNIKRTRGLVSGFLASVA